MTLTLRPLTADDLPIVGRWFEDEEARRWLGGPDWPVKALRLVESLGQLAFVALDNGRPVGLLDLRERSVDGLLVRDVAAHVQSTLGRSAVAGGDGDLVALGEERLGDGAADAAVAAGDEYGSAHDR